MAYETNSPDATAEQSATLTVSSETTALISGRVRPVAIDLFAGAGGLSLGFEMAGFDILSAVEYDPVHAATHLYNFPNTDVLCRDIKTVTAAELLASASRGWSAHYPEGPAWDGKVDVIVGGPSCQGFSIMGKRRVDDDRNQLVLEFVRLIEAVKPRAFCMENVPGFLHEQFSELRDEAFGRLRTAGYSVAGDTKALLATDFGVPQKRRRVVISGLLNGEAPLAPKPLLGTVSTVSDAFSGLPDATKYPSAVVDDLITLTAEDAAKLETARNGYLELSAITEDGSAHFGHARAVKSSVLSGCKTTIHKPESITRFSATPQGETEKVSRAYRLSESAASNTLRAGTGRERGSFSASRPLHPTAPRVITVREAARLHSFPDWFRFHKTNWHGHRQIGNAVPPLLAAAAAASILTALGLVGTKSRGQAIKLGPETLLSLTPTSAAAALQAVEAQVPNTREQQAARSRKAAAETLAPDEPVA